MATLEIMAVSEQTANQLVDRPVDEDEANDAVAKAAEWFEKDREAKASITRDMNEWTKLANGDHWDLLGPDGEPIRSEQQKRLRPNVVENVAFALVDGLVAEFSVDMEIIDIPTEPGDEEAALKLTKLKRFLAQKNRLADERQKWLRHLFGLGTGIWHLYWDAHWQGGRGPNRWIGDVRWLAQHPLTVFPDARCGDNIHKGYRIHKAVYVPIEYVKERWPERAEELQAEQPDADLIPAEDDELSAHSLEDMILLVETWYIGSPMLLAKGEEDEGKGLHCIWWAGEGQRTYLQHVNYVSHKGEEPRFPFIFRSRYPRDGSVWGYSEYHYLKSPQMVLNKTTEMVLEGHLQTSMGSTFYEAGALDEQQRRAIRATGGLPGAWIEVNDIGGIKTVFGQNLPASLQNEPVRLQRTMETLIGRFDISQGRTPGSVTAFRALDLLSHRAQVRLRAAEVGIRSSYEDLGRYTNQLLIENYTVGRVYRILGKEEEQGPQFDTFRVDEIKRVWLKETGTVIPFIDFVPDQGMEEGRDYEIFTPDFDCECKTTSTLPTDRIINMEMAKELLMANIIDLETFFHVMEHGQFPPWQELAQKAAERQMMQQQMMQAQMTEQMGQPMPEQATAAPSATPEAEFLASIIENLPPEHRAELASLSTDEQMAVLSDLLSRSMQQPR